MRPFIASLMISYCSSNRWFSVGSLGNWYAVDGEHISISPAMTYQGTSKALHPAR